MKRAKLLCVSLTLAMGLLAAQPAHATGKATRILYNGKVFTSVDANLWAEAVAWKGGIIQFVGSSAEALAWAGPNTELIDLGGRLVVPGFNDAHVHALSFFSFGPPIANPGEWIPGPGPSLVEVQAQIAAAAATYPAGTWLYGLVGEVFMDDPLAHRLSLSVVSPDHPVMLFGWTGHNVYLNDMAMEAQGLSDTTPDAPGGWYGRFVNGTLNGVLYEYAQYEFLRDHRMMLPPEVARAQLAQSYGLMNAFGITSAQDMSFLPQDVYADILAGMDLTVRIRNICTPVDWVEDGFDNCSNQLLNPFSMVNSTGQKIILDGTLVERNAAMNAPYLDAPQGANWKGVVNFSNATVRDMLRDGLRLPLAANQSMFHAFGNRSVTTLLTQMNAVGVPNWAWKLNRIRIEHGDFISPEQMPLLAARGVMVVVQPSHDATPDVFEQRYGPALAAQAGPYRSLLDNGVDLVLSTDGVGTAGDPFLEIALAVFHPHNPAQGITVEEAVIAFTRTAAKAEFMEHFKGVLAPGKFADLAVLSQDIFSLPHPMLMLGTYSHLTFVGGNAVHDDGTL